MKRRDVLFFQVVGNNRSSPYASTSMVGREVKPIELPKSGADGQSS
jgi:hypothetical protein